MNIIQEVKEELRDNDVLWLGELNDTKTRNNIKTYVDNFLTNHPNVDWFKVICNESNNPPDVIFNNSLIIDVKLKQHNEDTHICDSILIKNR